MVVATMNITFRSPMALPVKRWLEVYSEGDDEDEKRVFVCVLGNENVVENEGGGLGFIRREVGGEVDAAKVVKVCMVHASRRV